MTVCKIGREDYAQLRKAAKSSINAALSSYDAHRYAWMDEEEKEDIASDAIAKAWTTFREGAGRSFRSWVTLLAYQTTIDRLEAHRETWGITYATEDGDELEIAELTDWTTPEDEVVGWEREEAIESVLSNRSEEDRLIFLLRRQGYKPREIADRFGLTTNVVSVRLDRMKKAVAKTAA